MKGVIIAILIVIIIVLVSLLYFSAKGVSIPGLAVVSNLGAPPAVGNCSTNVNSFVSYTKNKDPSGTQINIINTTIFYSSQNSSAVSTELNSWASHWESQYATYPAVPGQIASLISNITSFNNTLVGIGSAVKITYPTAEWTIDIVFCNRNGGILN